MQSIPYWETVRLRKSRVYARFPAEKCYMVGQVAPNPKTKALHGVAGKQKVRE